MCVMTDVKKSWPSLYFFFILNVFPDIKDLVFYLQREPQQMTLRIFQQTKNENREQLKALA